MAGSVQKSGRRSHTLRASRRGIGGRHFWVLEDAAGIVEIADSKQVLAQDHPEACLEGDDTPPGVQR